MELCNLQRHQTELNGGRLHVQRVKNGTPWVDTMHGDEIRALRRLQRDYGSGDDDDDDAVTAFKRCETFRTVGEGFC